MAQSLRSATYFFFLRAAAAPFFPKAVRTFFGRCAMVFFFFAAAAAFLMFLRAAAVCLAEAIVRSSFSWLRLLFWLISSDRPWSGCERPSAPDVIKPDVKPRFLVRASTLFSQRVTASPRACVCLRCFLFPNRVWPAAALCWKPILFSEVATSLRPDALSISLSRSPARRSGLHVCPHECAPFPLAQTHPPASRATYLLVRLLAPVRLSLSLAYTTETARRLAADASFDSAYSSRFSSRDFPAGPAKCSPCAGRALSRVG